MRVPAFERQFALARRFCEMGPDMDSLIEGPSGANRPLFMFEGSDRLSVSAIPSGQFALSGPSEKLDAPHWPVRGDLAHVRLAGRVFVPHYAVPMERRVGASGADLRVAADAGAELRASLAGGTVFNVLDLSGGWAWGQVGEDGFVGYLPEEALAA
jgi:Bacterial dipeptidyl-peptidase Sh3 domain